MIHIINFLKGMIIGIANIIPGLSGGTMAILVGVYEKLISTIGNFFKKFKETFKENMIFLVPLGLGMVVGVVAFSKLLEILLKNYTMPTQFAFIGLVLGGLPLIFKNANKDGKFKKKYLIPLIITFIIGLTLSLLEKFGITGAEVSGIDLNPLNIFLLFIYGFIAAGTMVIPGISGSFMLMLLGVYNAILGYVASLNILVLIPFAIGAVAGVLILAKLIDVLLKKYHNGTYYAIIGFVVGAIPALYPGFSFNLQGVVSVITLILGFIGAVVFSKLDK
ncbi:MAG: DUF368 domain-containing protein [Clostridia bacterium]|nr:DUF368 domain-containing protein [Clostridia bacterium]